MKTIFRFFFACIVFASARGLNAADNPALIELNKLQVYLKREMSGPLGEQCDILRLKMPKYRSLFERTLNAGTVKGLEIAFISMFHTVPDPDAWSRLKAEESEKEVNNHLSTRPYDIVALEGGFGLVLHDPASLYVYAMQPLVKPAFLMEGLVDLSSLDAFRKTMHGSVHASMWKSLPLYEQRHGLYMGADDPALQALHNALISAVIRAKPALIENGVYEVYSDAEEFLSRLRSYFALAVLIERLKMDGKTKGAIAIGGRHCADLEVIAAYCSLTYRIVDTAGSYKFFLDNFTRDQKKY